jgi:TM2 domain-containing membrane protein YozV
MKVILVSIILVFEINSLSAQYLIKLPKVNQHYIVIDSSLKKEKLTEKSPVLAGTFSLLVPGFGLGQLYNGEKNKFLTHTIISASCISAFLITARFIGFPADGEPKGNRATISGILIFLSMITYAGNYVISAADAVVSAVRINEKVRLQKNRTQKSKDLYFGFGLDKNNKPNLKTVIYF